jgi:nitroimidazol reductase NimA-like FMN-containing flavoprotein (pyridoxamine 5'-phosphate oxidase superfamily)
MYPKIYPRIKGARRNQYLPMKATEAWSFVQSHFKMVLSTVDSRGFPHAAPVWYVVIGDKIYFRAQPYKKKIKNILQKPEACGVVEDGEKYTELRGVMIQGLARIVDSEKGLRKRVFELLAEKYHDRRDTDRFPKRWQETYGKEHRLVVEFKPIKIVSWDNRKWVSQT